MTSNNEKLLKSVLNKNLEGVKESLRSKCTLSYTDWVGHSSLHLAAMNGDLEIATLLLKSGASVNQLSKLNKSPLHFAAQNGYLDLVRLFVAYDCALNCIDVLKMTPLHWAVERNHFDVVRFLCMQYKLDSNLTDIFNRTCKDIAFKNGSYEILEVLNNVGSQNETELELEQIERQFKSSSLQQQQQQQQPQPPKLEDIPGLKEFYQKKYFAKSSSFSAMTAAAMNPKPSANLPCTSGLSNVKKSNHIVLEETSSDEDDEGEDQNDDDILEEKEMAKKKRLSMSPMNKIDDTLKWMKSQPTSRSDFSKYDFSLTEAGKLTLDLLNKNDPIRDEKRLFLKLVKDMEDEEKSNQEKMSISANSSPRSSHQDQDPNDLDDILFF